MELNFTANKSVHRRVDGQDGVSISSINYGASSSSTTEPSSWSGTVPTLSKGDWLWVKTTYTNGNVQYAKSYIGTDGEDGTSVYVQSVVKVDKTTTVTMIDGDGQTSTLTIVDGDDGEQGIAGLNGYVHIAWANSSDGSVDFSTSISTGKQYLGTYTDNTAQDSQTYSDYSWSKIKGEDGSAGTTISTIQYGVSASSTTAPSNWQDSVPSLSKGDWLWTKVNYSNNTTQYTKSYIGTDGDDGDSVYIQSATKTGKTTTIVLVNDEGTETTLTIDDGADGSNGTNGLNGYIHVAWANSSDGTVDFSTSVSTDKHYLGTYTDNTSTDSQTPSDYSWSKIKGENGANGTNGTNGADGATIYTVHYGKSSSATTEPSSWDTTVPSLSKGDWLWTKVTYSDSTVQYTKSYIGTDGDDGDSVYIQSATKVGKTTTVVLVNDAGTETTLTIVDGQDGTDGTNGLNGYIHVAWANSADGSVDFSTSVSANKQYLGTYTDNTQADSQTYSDYSWSKIKGEDGADGSDGSDGSDGEDAKVFDFKISSQTYTTNMRYSGKQEIQLTSVVQGYTGVVVYWSTTGGSFSSSSTETTTFATNPTLYIPYTYTGEITITLEDDSSGSSIQPVSKKISSVNATEYQHFFGLVTSESSISSYTDSLGNTCSPLTGDYFIWGGTTGTYTKGITYEYNSSTNPVWQALLKNEINGAQKLLNALNVIKQSGQDLSALNDPNTTSWLTDIIVDTLIANKLFAQAITIMTGGYIKGGTRYKNDGTINNWSEKGFWFGADGTLRANLQSDNAGNTFVGTNVGTSTVISSTTGKTGNYNTAMGYGSLEKNTTGDKNVAIGYGALNKNTTGKNNVAIGDSALTNNTTGDYNVGIGTGALASNTYGIYNVGIGYGAMNYTTYAQQNTAIGYGALLRNTSGSYNTAIGMEALKATTTGANNVAVGVSALTTNASGTQNTAVGTGALYSSTVNANTAIGYYALYSNTTGTGNTALGTSAGSTITTGTHNTAIGKSALSTVTTGGYNVGIGYDAEVYKASGRYQMNFNNSIIHLEFNASRKASEIFNVLKTYFPSATWSTQTVNVSVGAMGKIDNKGITHILAQFYYNGSQSTITIYTGSSAYDLTSSSTTTYTGRTIITFVNPNLTDTDRDSTDCLT